MFFSKPTSSTGIVFQASKTSGSRDSYLGKISGLERWEILTNLATLWEIPVDVFEVANLCGARGKVDLKTPVSITSAENINNKNFGKIY